MHALLLFMAVANVAGSASESSRILVMSIEAGPGISPDVAGLTTTILAAELRRMLAVDVVQQRDAEATLRIEEEKARAGVEANVGVVMAQALHADRIVTGSLRRLDSGFVQLSISLVQVRGGRVLARAMKLVPAGEEDRLAEAIPAIITELFGLDRATLPEPRAMVPPPAGHSDASPAWRLWTTRILRVAGGVALVAAAGAVLYTIAAAIVVAIAWRYDAQSLAARKIHGLRYPAILAVNALALSSVAAMAGVVLLLAAAAGAAGVSFVMP